MKSKILSILFYIFTAIIFIAGTWGLVYEFVILDKSIIPDFVIRLLYTLLMVQSLEWLLFQDLKESIKIS